MKFNQISIILIGACILALVALITAQTETNPPSNNDVINTNDANNGRSHRRSLFDFILTPLKSTIEHTKKFFGRRIDDAHDAYNSIPDIRMETFKMFMKLYNKTYPADEIPRRMALFFQRREIIEESQRLFEEGRELFAMRENEFTDWDDDELKKLAGVSLPSLDQMDDEEKSIFQLSNRFERSVDNDTILDSNENEVEDEDEDNMVVKQDTTSATKDWRTSGCVSTPINQYKCGACYAIATMSVVESMRCLKTVSSPILSPQQIVDCANARAGYANYGCDGGWPTRVLRYLQDKRVAAREKCYPFVRRQNSCKISQVSQKSGCTVSASWSGRGVQYKVLRNERDILYHVANTGPVVTVMKASDKFLYYGKGIFDDKRCSNRRDDVDHAIVIVGYGREKGVDYWIVKNSWGTTEWGIGGYGLYKRGKNACSIGHWGWVVTG